MRQMHQAPSSFWEGVRTPLSLPIKWELSGLTFRRPQKQKAKGSLPYDGHKGQYEC